jgi:hypothetical protein
MICFSGVTILLSLTVFSQVLADTMPATSDAIPLLGKNFKTLKNGHPIIHILTTHYPTKFMYAKLLPSLSSSMWTLYSFH